MTPRIPVDITGQSTPWLRIRPTQSPSASVDDVVVGAVVDVVIRRVVGAKDAGVSSVELDGVDSTETLSAHAVVTIVAARSDTAAVAIELTAFPRPCSGIGWYWSRFLPPVLNR